MGGRQEGGRNGVELGGAARLTTISRARGPADSVKVEIASSCLPLLGRGSMTRLAVFCLFYLHQRYVAMSLDEGMRAGWEE